MVKLCTIFVLLLLTGTASAENIGADSVGGGNPFVGGNLYCQKVVVPAAADGFNVDSFYVYLELKPGGGDSARCSIYSHDVANDWPEDELLIATYTSGCWEEDSTGWYRTGDFTGSLTVNENDTLWLAINWDGDYGAYRMAQDNPADAYDRFRINTVYGIFTDWPDNAPDNTNANWSDAVPANAYVYSMYIVATSGEAADGYHGQVVRVVID